MVERNTDQARDDGHSVGIRLVGAFDLATQDHGQEDRDQNHHNVQKPPNRRLRGAGCVCVCVNPNHTLV